MVRCATAVAPMAGARYRDVGSEGAVARDVGVEDREQPGQVAAGAGLDERFGDLSIGFGLDAELALVGDRADALTSPTGELPTGRRGAAHGLADRLERDLEHVVHDEHDALGRREPLQDHLQRGPDTVVERHPVRGVDAQASGVAGDVEAVGGHRPIEAGAGRAELIEADATGHDGQPAAVVIDLTWRGPQESRVGLLHGILGRADVAEEPERDVDQMCPMRVPGATQPVVALVTHGHLSPDGACGSGFEWRTNDGDRTRHRALSRFRLVGRPIQHDRTR